MVDKVSLINRISHHDKQDIFHTSAYSKMQSGSSMGAASTTSFSNRMNMENNRINISKYSRSGIARRAAFSNTTRAKTYEPASKTTPTASSTTPSAPPRHYQIPKKPGISH